MLYAYGLVVAGILIGGTVLLAIGLNRAREWWEARRARLRQAPDPQRIPPRT